VQIDVCGEIKLIFGGVGAERSEAEVSGAGAGAGVETPTHEAFFCFSEPL
jgi:hypothetical protein